MRSWDWNDGDGDPDDDIETRHYPAGPRTGLVMATSAIVSATVTTILFFTLNPMQETNEVPALVGLELGEALRTGRAHGFKLVVGGSINDPIVAKGAVASQSPVAGKQLPIGTRVIVKLSDGPIGKRPPPDLTSVPPPSPPPPQPRARSPRPASPRKQSETKAPAPPPPPVGPMVTVPRVTGRRLSRARSALERVGLTVSITYSADEDRIDTAVLSQRPTAGQRVERGSTVRLVVNDTSNL